MNNKLTADQYAEILFESIQTLINGSIDELKFDRTEVCTILTKPNDPKDPYELTLDGINIIEAYGEALNYMVGEQVLVSFPKDDTKHKTILSRYNAEDDAINFVFSRERFAEVARAIRSGEVTLNTSANNTGSASSIVLSDTSTATKNNNVVGLSTIYNQLGTFNSLYLKTTVTTDLPNNMISGNYGLLISVLMKDSTKNLNFIFDSSSMLGNPYAFKGGFTQEALYNFELPVNEPVEAIEVYAYQKGNFKYKDKDGKELKAEGSIQFTDIQLSAGFDVQLVEDNTVILYSHEPQEYNVGSKTVELEEENGAVVQSDDSEQKEEVKDTIKNIELVYLNKDIDEKYLGFNDAIWNRTEAKKKRGIVTSVSHLQNGEQGWAILIEGADFIYKCTQNKPYGLTKWEKDEDTKEYVPDYDSTEISVGDTVVYEMEPISEGSSLYRFAYVKTLMPNNNSVPNYYCIDWEIDNPYGVYTVKEMSDNYQGPGWALENVECHNSLKNTRVRATVWYNGESYSSGCEFTNAGAINNADMLQGGISIKIKHGPYSESNYPLYDGNSLQLIGGGKHTLRELHFGYNVGETRINDLYWDESRITWEPQGAMLVAEPAQAIMYYFDPAEIIEVKKNEVLTQVQKYIYGVWSEGKWKTPEEDEITDIKSTDSKIVGGDFDELVREFFEKNEEDKSIVIKEDVEYCLRYNEEKEVYQLLGLKSSMVGNLVNAKYYYKVEEFFNPNAINENSITCTVNIPVKQGGEILSYAQDDDVVNFSFATFGASGTDYTIMFSRKANDIYIKVVDSAGKQMDSTTTMQYKWYDGSDIDWTSLTFNSDLEAQTGFPYVLNVSGRAATTYNLLQVRAYVQWQDTAVWVKGFYSVITPYPTDKDKDNKSIYSFDVPYTIIYNNQGTDPQWNNNSLVVYKNGVAQEGYEWSIKDYTTIESVRLPWRKKASLTEAEKKSGYDFYEATVAPPEGGKIVLSGTPRSTDGYVFTGSLGEITTLTILKYQVPANTYEWYGDITATIHGNYNDSGIVIENIKDEEGVPLANHLRIKVPNILLNNNIQIALVASGDENFNIPIYVGINPYGSATLNKWDGSLVVDNKNNYILSAMVGAGHKNTDNTFTGVIMGDYGKLEDNNVSNSRTGLFGFDAGVQTFELNTNGTATLGRMGAGQIIFDGNQGVIKSNGWTTESNGAYTLTNDMSSGTIIDLDDAAVVMNTNNDNYLKFNNGNSGKLEIKASSADITFTDQDNSLATIIENIENGISMSLKKVANYYGICTTANNADPSVNSSGSFNNNILTKTVELTLESDQAVDEEQMFKDGVTIAVTFQHHQEVARSDPYAEVTLNVNSYEKNKYYIKDATTDAYILCIDDTFDDEKEYYRYREPTYSGKELHLKIEYDEGNNSFITLGTHPVYLNGIQTGSGNPFGWGVEKQDEQDEQGATIFFTFANNHWEVVDSGSYNRSIWTDKQFSREIADTNAGIGSLISQTAGEIRAEVRRTANYYGECFTADGTTTKEVSTLTRIDAGQGSITNIPDDELFQKGATIAITFTNAETVSTEYYNYTQVTLTSDSYIPGYYYVYDEENEKYTLDSDGFNNDGTTYYTRSVKNTPAREGKELSLYVNKQSLPIYIKGTATGEDNPFGWDAGSTIYFVYDKENDDDDGFWRVGDSGSYSKIIETADGIYTEVGTENGRLQSSITQTARNIRMEVASKANYYCTGTISETATAQWDIEGVPDGTELKPGCALMITFSGTQEKNTTDTNITFKIHDSGYVVSGSPVWNAGETLPFVVLDEYMVAMTSISSAQLDITENSIIGSIDRTGGYACLGTANADTGTNNDTRPFDIELLDTSDNQLELEKTGITISVFFDKASYDIIPSYTEVNTSIVIYQPNVYYFKDTSDNYVLSNEDKWDTEKTYYKETEIKICKTIELTYNTHTLPAYYKGAQISSTNPFYWDANDTVFFSYVPKIGTNDPYWMVVDSGSQSKSIQTADMIAQVVEDVEGNYSAIIQTVDRIEQTVEDVEGNYSTIEQTVDEIKSEVGKTIKRYTCDEETQDEYKKWHYIIKGATQEEYNTIINEEGSEFIVSFGAGVSQTDPTRNNLSFKFIIEGEDNPPSSDGLSIVIVPILGSTWDANETLAFRVQRIVDTGLGQRLILLILTQASSSKITQTKEAITSEVRRTAGYACIAAQEYNQTYANQNIELWVLDQISDAQDEILTVEDICLPGVTLAVTFNNYSSKEDNKDQWSYYLRYSDGKSTVDYPIYVRGAIAGTVVDDKGRVTNPLSWEAKDTLFLSFFEPGGGNAGGWRVVDSGAYSKIQQTADSIKATVIEELGDEFATVEMTKDMITNTVGVITYTGYNDYGSDQVNKIVELDNKENLTAADIFVKGRSLAVIFKNGNMGQTNSTIRTLKVMVKANEDAETTTPYNLPIWYQDKDELKKGLFPLEPNTKVYFTYKAEDGGYWLVGGGEYSVLQQTKDALSAEVAKDGNTFGWNITSSAFNIYSKTGTTTNNIFTCSSTGVNMAGWEVTKSNIKYDKIESGYRILFGMQPPTSDAVNLLAIGKIKDGTVGGAWSDAQFKVTKDGTLHTSKISATGGSIGGWKLKQGTWGTRSSYSALIGGVTVADDATAATIASYAGDTGSFCLYTSFPSTSTQTVGGYSSANWRLTIGQKFGVDSQGRLYCNGGTFTGDISGASVAGGNIVMGYNEASSTAGGIYTSDRVAGLTLEGDVGTTGGFNLFTKRKNWQVGELITETGYEPVLISANNGTGTLRGTWRCNTTPIAGSDQNIKYAIQPQSNIYSQIFDKLQPVTFKLKQGISKRTHMGLIAQQVEDAVLSTGLTTQDFAPVCYDLQEDGTAVNYGIRYSELVSMCIYEIQQLKHQIKLLQGENGEK